jgi:phosphoglycolate phosphatase
MIDALVFDLDGTLWDAAAASTRGWNRALEQMGVSSRVTVDDIRSVSGRPFARCVEVLLPELGPATEHTLRALEERERIEIEAVGGRLYQGVADGLLQLTVVYRLFLVSNCPGWYLDAFFRASDLRECFTGWDCHGSSGLSKAAMLVDLNDRFDLGYATYVGDTRGDQEAAAQARMEFAFVRYGFGEVGPVPLAFDSFGDLATYYLRLGAGRSTAGLDRDEQV